VLFLASLSITKLISLQKSGGVLTEKELVEIEKHKLLREIATQQQQILEEERELNRKVCRNKAFPVVFSNATSLGLASFVVTSPAVRASVRNDTRQQFADRLCFVSKKQLLKCTLIRLQLPKCGDFATSKCEQALKGALSMSFVGEKTLGAKLRQILLTQRALFSRFRCWGRDSSP